MKINKTQNPQAALFIIAWTLFVTSLILESCVITLNNDALSLALKITRYIAYLICCINIIQKAIRNDIYILLIAIVAVFANCYLQSQNATMPLYSLILLAALGVSQETIIKTTVFVQGVLLFGIILLSQLGIIQDYIFGNVDRMRHGLGFTWTTTGAILFFYMSMSAMTLYKNKVNWMLLIVMLGINYWLYKMTDSRMSFYLCTLMLLFFLVQAVNPYRWNFISRFKPVYVAMPFIMEIFAVVLFSSYKNTPLWNKLDKFLSGRLVLGSDAIEDYGFTWLGQKIEWIGYSIERPTLEAAVGYNYVDSSYLQLTLNYGIIFMLVVLTLYSVAIYKAIKAEHYNLLVIYMLILLFSLTEPRLMDFAYNPYSILALSSMTALTEDEKKTTGRIRLLYNRMKFIFGRKIKFYNE